MFGLGASASPQVGVHDIVDIKCSTVTSLSGKYRVQPNGSIVVPTLGTLTVITRTNDQIQSLLLKRITETHGVLDQCTVSTKRDKFSGVRVTGAISKPVTLSMGTSTSYAKLIEALPTHDGADKNSFSVSDAEGRPISQSAPARSGDVLNIPLQTSGGEIYMLGGVKNPGTFAFKQGMTLGHILDFCGGLTPRAKPDRIFIKRQTELGPFDSLKDRNIPIQRGDSIRIELNAEVKYVSITGLVKNPLNLEWSPNLTALEVIRKAGGVTYPKATVVIRSLVDNKKKPIRIKWLDLEKDITKDVKLQPNDIVDVVPK